ncbi:hypothetical protein SLA2020_452580 [Shorea laevis]
MDARLIAKAVSVNNAPPVVPLVFGLSPSSGVVRLSGLFSSNVLPETLLEGVSLSDGGLIPLTQCHPTSVVKEVYFQFDGYILVRPQMTVLSLTATRWITQVMLASSAKVLRFNGPTPVSLPLLSLEPMVVLDRH